MSSAPQHYKDTILMDYLISHKIGFAEGNICKYVVRWDKKDGIKDLYKARDYLNALIAGAELSPPLTLPKQFNGILDPYTTQTQDLFDGIK